MSVAPFSEEKVKELQEKFDLTYHIPYLSVGMQMVGFEGMKVLEVGGSLPKGLIIDEIGASQWVAIEKTEYWNELPEFGENEVQGTVPRDKMNTRVAASAAPSSLGVREVLEGEVEEIPDSYDGHFDRIFSIACFEHVQTMGAALRAMYRALKPGGKLFTMFSPIWSAHDGHHLPRMKDSRGEDINTKENPVTIPPWGHLLANPLEMEGFLQKSFDSDTAERIVYYLYRSNHINRFMTDDYLGFFTRSPFKADVVKLTFESSLPEPAKTLLPQKYPNNKNFANNGILAILSKPSD